MNDPLQSYVDDLLTPPVGPTTAPEPVPRTPVPEAEPALAAMPSPADIEWVVFNLAGQGYGLRVAQVREIIRVPLIEPVPHAPSQVIGVSNLRGAVLTVWDTASLLGLPVAADTPATRIIVAEHGDDVLGLRVDSVSEVLRRPASEVTPSPLANAMRIRPAGMLRANGRLIQLLALDALLEALLER
jgi:purine-binding chemotaxis protein CheW